MAVIGGCGETVQNGLNPLLLRPKYNNTVGLIMNILKQLCLLACVLVISACSVTQTVESVLIQPQDKVCVVDNPKVKKGFLESLKTSLDAFAIDYQVVSEESLTSKCEWTIKYTATWSWDIALYMNYARISAYQNNKLKGYVDYDTRGSIGLNKYSDADEKIRELVEGLLKK